MSLPAPVGGEVFLVTIRSQLFGQMVLATYKYQITGIGSEGDIGTLAANLFAKLNVVNGLIDTYRKCAPPAQLFLECWIQVIFPVRYRKFVFNLIGTGSYSDDTVITNLAATITRTGDQANKHNRGSLHLVYPSEDPGTAAGTISGPFKVVMDSHRVQMLLLQITTGSTNLTPGLMKAKATAITDFVPITSTISQTTVRVMRRRTVGVGI